LSPFPLSLSISPAPIGNGPAFTPRLRPPDEMPALVAGGAAPVIVPDSRAPSVSVFALKVSKAPLDKEEPEGVSVEPFKPA